jgi:hypothetical protein
MECQYVLPVVMMQRSCQKNDESAKIQNERIN